MRRQTYREGWIAGYVFNMVKHRPDLERFETNRAHDRYLPPNQDKSSQTILNLRHLARQVQGALQKWLSSE